MRRVVITGMGALSPIGNDWSTISRHLQQQQSGVRYQHDWDQYANLNTKLGAPLYEFQIPAHFNRKITRSMGKVAIMAVMTAEAALQDAGLLGDASIKNGRMGVAFGSSTGNPEAVQEFANMLEHNDVRGINATTYIRMMGHTAPVNIGVYFGLTGRIIPTSSACTSGSQGIGYAYEAIKFGLQDLMIAGGCEELCASEAAVFDTLFATSRMNDTPELSPRPFDRDRDGLVIGEGSGALILEEYKHAKARGAKIYAEIKGFACNSDGAHITQPNSATMQIVMQNALLDAKLAPSDIGYISAHGTATAAGDVAESQASYRVFGGDTPISSLKSYMGHTLGACGALEAIFSIHMQREAWFAVNKNLQNVDPNCAELDYIMGNIRQLQTEFIISNNFAFGGINTAIILGQI